MIISKIGMRTFSILILLISFIGFVYQGFQNFANPYNWLPIIFFIGGMLSLIYETNQINISHIPITLKWDDSGDEYVLSPSSQSEKYGLLRIFLKKSGFFKIVLNEIVINTPDFIKIKIQIGKPTGNIRTEKDMNRIIYYIPMKMYIRKNQVIGIDIRAEKSQAENLYFSEIDITVKYDLKFMEYKILGCENTISI